MKIILKQDVKGTGKAGDIVNVSDGFARNRLIPQGIAVPATAGSINAVKREKAARAAREAANREEAEVLAKKLENVTVTIQGKMGEAGKLFGSITSMDIAEAVSEQTGLKLDKKKILLDKPIKEAGITEVEIKLYTDVTAKVKINVAKE